LKKDGKVLSQINTQKSITNNNKNKDKDKNRKNSIDEFTGPGAGGGR
jgi:hypothetical protein